MLNAPFCVQTQAAGLITVPAGFVTDLTSLPSFLWWESLPSDWAEAAVPHDWAYKGNLPRDVADKVYRELAGALGMPSRMVAVRYYALRWFGGKAYRPNQVPKS